MSSALLEPPDSGVKTSANAAGAAIRTASRAVAEAAMSRRRCMPEGKAAGSYLRPPPRLYFVAVASSGALEDGLPLLHEGLYALLEVLGPGERVLQLGLEVELAVEVRVEHAVERLLGAGVGARGA